MKFEEDQDRIERVVELDAPIARVWRAITDHEEFGAWFGVRLEGPFRVGETTRGQVTYPGQEHVEWVTTTERMEPEHLFVFSWPPNSLDPDTEHAANAKMLTEFRLVPIGRGTRLTISESGFLQLADSKRSECLQSCIIGWETQARNFADHLHRQEGRALPPFPVAARLPRRLDS